MEICTLFVENELPNVLTDSEFEDNFRKFKSGDMEARNILINHNIRLVLYRIINNFRNFNVDRKELLASGLIGLIKGIDSYDLSRNIKFTTYASICIDNEILMFLRKEKKHFNVDSLDRKIGNDDSDNSDLTIGAFLKSDEESGYDKIYKEECNASINEVISNLSEREQIVIKLYFGFIDDKCYTQTEIAEKLQLSQSYTSRILKSVLQKVRKQLVIKGIIECSSNSKIKIK